MQIHGTKQQDGWCCVHFSGLLTNEREEKKNKSRSHGHKMLLKMFVAFHKPQCLISICIRHFSHFYDNETRKKNKPNERQQEMKLINSSIYFCCHLELMQSKVEILVAIWWMISFCFNMVASWCSNANIHTVNGRKKRAGKEEKLILN